MTYDGRIKDGAIVLDRPLPFPEGAQVRVNVEEIEGKTAGQTDEVSPLTALLSLAGSVEGPVDWSRNHDHYIHGTAKK